MTIPASNIVQVNPGVIGAGGNSLGLNGVILSQSVLIPTNSVQSFPSADAVSAFFGPASAEAAIAPNYFNGFDNKTLTPGTLYFAPFVLADRAAWLQSGSLAGMTLTQLQALSGTIILTVDGTLRTSGTINFSGATSFTNAATLITAGFSGSPLTATWNAVLSVFILTSSTTGATSTITFATGTLSTSLKLTSATGAVLSQGDTADTPGSAMDNVVLNTNNWFSFATMWEPILSDKNLFAAWSNGKGQRYLYVCWDTDAQAIVNGATTPFGVVQKGLASNGVMAVYNTLALAVFVLGTGASIDFSRTNGRITVAFKSQSGFTPTVTSEQIAANLLANGYSFYGQYATAATIFNFFYDGNIPGIWKWFDSYANQVFLNSQFKDSLMTLLITVKSVPYNQSGYSLIRAALTDPINAALNFGSIRTGVILSALQKAELAQQAGLDIGDIVQQIGYFVQVLDPGAQVRANRGTPVCNVFYADGQAVQKITLASIDIL